MSRTHISIDYSGVAQISLSNTAKTCLYRFLQEALTNVLKHAYADYVRVRFSHATDMVSLSVEDNGQGFDPQIAVPAEHQSKHLGLSNMRERLTLLGGWLELDTQPGRGTRLVAHIPEEKFA